MASAKILAKQAGLDPVTCGKCGSSIKTGEPFTEFFKSLVERCRDGEKVNIPGLGTFSTREMKGRKVKSPVLPNGTVEFPDQMILRFSASESVRGVLNPEIHGKEAKEAKAAKEAEAAKPKKKASGKKKASSKKKAASKKSTKSA